MVEYDLIFRILTSTDLSGNMQITPFRGICQRLRNYFLIFGRMAKEKPHPAGAFTKKPVRMRSALLSILSLSILP